MNEKQKIGFMERSHKVAAKCRTFLYYEICRDVCQRSREYLLEEDAYISYFYEGYRYFFEYYLERMKEIAAGLRR